jgi:hypothetical protein
MWRDVACCSKNSEARAMRKLFALSLLMVSLMFATSPAHAEWAKWFSHGV